MRLHYLQHVAFEGLGHIAAWAGGHGIPVTRTGFHDGEVLPGMDEFELLVVMGGPMSVHDEKQYGWLVAEKRFIREAIDGGKNVLGVCLGAQLIAESLGARVYRNGEKEIGWFDVMRTEESGDSVLRDFPARFGAFHWHGETFDMPRGCTHLLRSEVCENQGFVYDEQVYGFQFHMESTRESVEKLITHCREEIVEGRHIQTAEEMRTRAGEHAEANALMSRFLDSAFVG